MDNRPKNENWRAPLPLLESSQRGKKTGAETEKHPDHHRTFPMSEEQANLLEFDQICTSRVVDIKAKCYLLNASLH